MKTAHEVLRWVEENGEPLALSRLCVRMISHSVASGVDLRKANEFTQCRPDYLAILHEQASLVTGKRCP
jgi:hypothetical protein